MHTRIEGDKLLITLDLSVQYDPSTAGFVVCERDGTFNLDHEISWGPMPQFLIEAFVADRCEIIKSAIEQCRIGKLGGGGD